MSLLLAVKCEQMLLFSCICRFFDMLLSLRLFISDFVYLLFALFSLLVQISDGLLILRVCIFQLADLLVMVFLLLS